MQSILSFLFRPPPSFERFIEEVTEPTLSAPRGQAVRELMEMLSGSHPAVRCEFVFISLLARVHRDQSHSPWTSQLKCMLLLDRLGHDLHFSGEVAQLPSSLFTAATGEVFLGVRTQKLTFSFWELVRLEARVFQGRGHVLCFRRRQRRVFLQGLVFPQLLQQLETLAGLFRSCLEVGRELQGRDRQTFQERLHSVELVQYIALNLAHKMMAYYACCLLCFQECASILIQQEETLLHHLEALCLNFQANSFELVRFLKVFKKARGFSEFNYQEFNPFQNAKLPQAITAVLKGLQEQTHPLIGHLFPDDTPQLQVNMPPLSEVNVKAHSLYPRIKCPSYVEERSSPFSEWIISFSDAFPPADIMTLDLIMAVRDKEKEGEQEEVLQYDFRSSNEVYFDDQSSFVEASSSLFTAEDSKDSLLTQNPSHTSIMQPAFTNIFSPLPTKWNSP